VESVWTFTCIRRTSHHQTDLQEHTKVTIVKVWR